MNKSWNLHKSYKEAFRITREHGIEVSISMMLGADGDSLNTFRKVKKFIIENRIVLPKLYILTPMPGTPFFKMMKNANRILTTDLTRYTGGCIVFKPANFAPDELEKQYWTLYRNLHSVVNIVRRLCKNPAKLNLTMRFAILIMNINNRRHIYRKIVPGLS